MSNSLSQTRLGVNVIISYCMVKALIEPEKYDQSMLEKAKSILRKLLSSEISYTKAITEANGDAKMLSAISSAKLILDTLKIPSTNKRFENKIGNTPRYWSDAEDMRLLGGILIYGEHNFREVSSFVNSGRGRAQCLQRWNRTLNPNIKRDKWTASEDSRLVEIVNSCIPLSWTRVAKMLGERTDVQCRYRYQHIMKSRMKTIAGCRKGKPPSVKKNDDVFTSYNVEKFLCCFA